MKCERDVLQNELFCFQVEFRGNIESSGHVFQPARSTQRKCLKTKIKFRVLSGKWSLRIKMNPLLRPQNDFKVEPHRLLDRPKARDLKGFVPQQPHGETQIEKDLSQRDLWV